MGYSETLLASGETAVTEPERSRDHTERLLRRARVPFQAEAGRLTVSQVDEIELLPFSAITDDDLTRTGEPDVEHLRRRTAHAGPVRGVLTRISAAAQ